MDPKLKALLASRKFWAALVGLTVMILKSQVPNFPLAEDQLLALVVIIVSYILGTAVEDARRPAQPPALKQDGGTLEARAIYPPRPPK